MDIVTSAKLAFAIIELIRDPENSIIKLIDELNENRENTSKLSKWACEKLDADGLIVEIKDKSIKIIFNNLENPTDIIISYVEKLSKEFGLLLIDVDIDEFLAKTPIIYNPNERTCEIEVFIPSEKVMRKLHEVVEEGGDLNGAV